MQGAPFLKHLISSVFACIAQLVEQVTFNDLVGGSSPPARTTLRNGSAQKMSGWTPEFKTACDF
ncbi:hypothetical protein VCHA53O466_40056 [Vibrio chagasii]|nr:hypothetical protein VCHA53O466_40056 [Vibrio chagasii]